MFFQPAGNLEKGNNDIELWKAFKKGDENAFSFIYRTHIKALYQYGHKISPDTRVIEDSIQDLFVDLWKSRENLSDTDSIKFYLFRILRRKISRNLLYSDRSEPLEESQSGLMPHSIPGTESYENELIENESRGQQTRQLSHALSQLPSRQKEVVNLRYFHGFSHSRIAELMGISLQSVHNLLQKSMKSLRGLLVENPGLLLSFLVTLL